MLAAFWMAWNLLSFRAKFGVDSFRITPYRQARCSAFLPLPCSYSIQ